MPGTSLLGMDANHRAIPSVHRFHLIIRLFKSSIRHLISEISRQHMRYGEPSSTNHSPHETAVPPVSSLHQDDEQFN